MTRRRSLVLLAALAVVAIGAVLFLRDPGSADAAVLRYVFKAEERRTYALDLRVRLAPTQGNRRSQPLIGEIQARMMLEVVDKRDDGSTLLELSMHDVTTKPPRPKSPADSERVRLRIAPDGRIRAIEGGGGVLALAGVDPGALLGGSDQRPAEDAGIQALFPHFPARAIRPGGEWSQSTALPLRTGANHIDVKTEGRLESYDLTRRGRAARLRMKVSAPLDYSLTVPQLRRGIEEPEVTGGPAPTPRTQDDVTFNVVGRSETSARYLVLARTGELIELTGTTRMSVRMTIAGDRGSSSQGRAADYSFDAVIDLGIARTPV